MNTNSLEAMQRFIDQRIPRDKQELYPSVVQHYKAAWIACDRYRDEEFRSTVDSVYSFPERKENG